jgi:hypothetical protein
VRKEGAGRARGAQEARKIEAPLHLYMHATTVLSPAFAGATPLLQRGLHLTLPVAAAWSTSLRLPRRMAPPGSRSPGPPSLRPTFICS